MKRPTLTTTARHLVFGLTIALAVGASGCALNRREDPFTQKAAQRKEIEIRIDNANFSNAIVWTMLNETRQRRLGLVSGKTDETFKVKWDRVQRLRIEFDMQSGPTCYTELIWVEPGDVLEIEIPSSLNLMPGCR